MKKLLIVLSLFILSITYVGLQDTYALYGYYEIEAVYYDDFTVSSSVDDYYTVSDTNLLENSLYQQTTSYANGMSSTMGYFDVIQNDVYYWTVDKTTIEGENGGASGRYAIFDSTNSIWSYLVSADFNDYCRSGLYTYNDFSSSSAYIFVYGPNVDLGFGRIVDWENMYLYNLNIFDEFYQPDVSEMDQIDKESTVAHYADDYVLFTGNGYDFDMFFYEIDDLNLNVGDQLYVYSGYLSDQGSINYNDNGVTSFIDEVTEYGTFKLSFNYDVDAVASAYDFVYVVNLSNIYDINNIPTLDEFEYIMSYNNCSYDDSVCEINSSSISDDVNLAFIETNIHGGNFSDFDYDKNVIDWFGSNMTFNFYIYTDSYNTGYSSTELSDDYTFGYVYQGETVILDFIETDFINWYKVDIASFNAIQLGIILFDRSLDDEDYVFLDFLNVGFGAGSEPPAVYFSLESDYSFNVDIQNAFIYTGLEVYDVNYLYVSCDPLSNSCNSNVQYYMNFYNDIPVRLTDSYLLDTLTITNDLGSLESTVDNNSILYTFTQLMTDVKTFDFIFSIDDIAPSDTIEANYLLKIYEIALFSDDDVGISIINAPDDLGLDDIRMVCEETSIKCGIVNGFYDILYGIPILSDLVEPYNMAYNTVVVIDTTLDYMEGAMLYIIIGSSLTVIFIKFVLK